ncbi:MAG: TIGR03084 family metal-binding protein [Mycobacterium sp.]
MADAGPLISELEAESTELDTLVAPLSPADWHLITPAPGWSIAHQIAHLLWTDQVAALSATDPAAFAEVLTAALSNPRGFVDAAAADLAQTDPRELLQTWRTARAQLHTALRTVPDGHKLPWFGPPMSAASMATARLMETWAHGLDVADTLGVQRVPTSRLRSIAHLGVRTRDFAFTVHGLTPPTATFHVELSGPDGESWTWGPSDAAQRVTGSAEDFCLLVTQRRARATLDVTAVGAEAEQWLAIAQAFAGPPGVGR